MMKLSFVKYKNCNKKHTSYLEANFNSGGPSRLLMQERKPGSLVNTKEIASFFELN